MELKVLYSSESILRAESGEKRRPLQTTLIGEVARMKHYLLKRFTDFSFLSVFSLETDKLCRGIDRTRFTRINNHRK